MEDRVRELELEVAVVKTTVANMIVAIDNNTKAQEKLAASQEELAAVFNQAKGIKFLLVGLFIIGTFVTDICLRIFGDK